MNKFLIVVIAFAVIAVNAGGPSDPKSEELKYMEECKTEIGATDDDIKTLMNSQSLQSLSEKAWCIVGCIKKKTGEMGADNKFNLDKHQQMMASMKEHDPEKYEKIMSNMKQCNTEVGSNAANLANACTAAKALAVCVKSKM